MQQTTFVSLALVGKKKQTKREKFSFEMDRVVPWEKLTARIAPHYPKAGEGRRPIGLASARQNVMKI